jgi:hypothetical protein
MIKFSIFSVLSLTTDLTTIGRPAEAIPDPHGGLQSLPGRHEHECLREDPYQERSMPAPNRQNGTGVTAETVKLRGKEGYIHEKAVQRQSPRPRKSLSKGGNGEGGPKWLHWKRLQRRP